MLQLPELNEPQHRQPLRGLRELEQLLHVRQQPELPLCEHNKPEREPHKLSILLIREQHKLERKQMQEEEPMLPDAHNKHELQHRQELMPNVGRQKQEQELNQDTTPIAQELMPRSTALVMFQFEALVLV
mgnify:CR=1 FL=1